MKNFGFSYTPTCKQKLFSLKNKCFKAAYKLLSIS